MNKREALRTLREILMVLYPMKEDSVRVVQDAGMNAGQVSFSNRAIDNWRNILTEAERQGRVEDVVRVALTDYRSDPELIQAHKTYLKVISLAPTTAAPIVESPEVDLEVVARLLRTGFRATTLRRFCLYRPRFRLLLDEVGDGSSLNELVDALIEFCLANDMVHELLKEVEAERPRHYVRFKEQLFE